MSITVTYTCDRCGSAQTTNEQFWTLEVQARCNTQFPYEVAKIQVCRPCLELLGIHRRVKEGVKDKRPAPPTVEDLIREIIERCQP